MSSRDRGARPASGPGGGSGGSIPPRDPRSRADRDANDLGGAKGKAQQAAGQAQEKTQQVAGQAQEKASQVGGQAQEKASQVAGQAQEKASEVAGQAQEKAQEVTAQGAARARQLIDERSSQAGQQVAQQADDLRSVSEALREQGKDGPARLADQAAQRAERLGRYLERADSNTILQDIEDVGRRQPWTVALGGLAVGFAASRFLKASSSQRYQAYSSGQGRASAQPSYADQARYESTPTYSSDSRAS